MARSSVSPLYPTSKPPLARRIRFEFGKDVPLMWTPSYPEMSAAANSISLLMPHVEPYVLASVRAVLDQLPTEQQDAAAAFIAQEAQHQLQHRRFNALITPQIPGMCRVERWMHRTYTWLQRTRTPEFSLAFAAGFETVAFALARWTELQLHRFFEGADEQITTLFLWHLAEEVEHKSVAFDAYEAVDGSKLRYLVAALLSIFLLSSYTLIGAVLNLKAQGRHLNPIAWWRLGVCAISLAWEVLPDVAASAMPHHHPTDFADPVALTTWLKQYDPETASMPLWWTSAAQFVENNKSAA
ncbi:MAG: metal-dependent hydrolase [Microthrixaceae bacterium]